MFPRHISRRRSPTPALLRTSMSPQHEHWFPPLFIQLLKQEQRFLFQSQTSLLIAMHNIQSVLSPIVRNIVSLQRLVDNVREAVALMLMMVARTYYR